MNITASLSSTLSISTTKYISWLHIVGILSSRIIKICANIKLHLVYINLQNESIYQYFLHRFFVYFSCTFTGVKLKKQYFYWSNILKYVSVLLLKYLICVLRPPLVFGIFLLLCVFVVYIRSQLVMPRSQTANLLINQLCEELQSSNLTNSK